MTFPLRYALLFGALLVTFRAFGAVTITPGAPTESSPLTIEVANSFGAEAFVTSASITRAGNAFVIQQNVDISLTQPSNPAVSSHFDVGLLAPGAYTVTANIVFTGVLGPTPPPITQTASFVVIAAVPTLNGVAFLVLAFALSLAGVLVVRFRN